MERDVAEKLMAEYARLEAIYGRVEAHLREIEDESERKDLLRGFAEVAGGHFTDLLLPVMRQYPDLDPDKNISWWDGLKNYTV